MCATMAKLRMNCGSGIGEPGMIQDGPASDAGPERPAGSRDDGVEGRGAFAAIPKETGPRDHGGVVVREGPVGEEHRDAVDVAPAGQGRAELRVGGDAAGE